MNRLKNYIIKNWISVIANVFIGWILFMLLGIFYVLEDTSTHILDGLDGQKSIFTELYQPIYHGGIILVLGLSFMLVAKGLKKSMVTIIAGSITLIIYFWKMKIVGI